MKKLLVIATLLLALVITFVACTEENPSNNPTAAETTVETPTEDLIEKPTEEPTATPTDPSEETTEEPSDEVPTEELTTEEPTTEEPTTEEPTTEEPTTEEPTTEEPTTEEPTTEELTTEEPTTEEPTIEELTTEEPTTEEPTTEEPTTEAPEPETEYVEMEDAGMKSHAFDTFYVNGSMYFEVDGDAGGRLTLIDNTIRFAEGEPHESMALRGWVGFEKPIVSFGYFIDNSNMIYGDFKQATEGGVLAAGGAYASRFQIDVPLADLEAGAHSVGFVAKLEDGTVVRLRANLTVIIPEKPIVEDPVGPDVERYEDLVVDMSTLGGSGYMAEYPAAGYTSPIQILGYYVTINLGQVDLSKYSAVKITYGCDGSPNTDAEFAASSSLAIGLKSEDSSYGQETTDNFSGDIAHTQMVFSSISWAGGAREAIVDLSNIDYNGNVWIAVHNPGGTQIAISAIEFIGAEKVHKPINPADPVVLVTPEDLLARYNEGSVYSASQVASAEVMTEGDRTFIRLTANGIDPYISLITANSATPVLYYMAIAYRTNSSSRGQFYVGSTGL